jgi:hypothetical protein
MMRGRKIPLLSEYSTYGATPARGEIQHPVGDQQEARSETYISMQHTFCWPNFRVPKGEDDDYFTAQGAMPMTRTLRLSEFPAKDAMPTTSPLRLSEFTAKDVVVRISRTKCDANDEDVEVVRISLTRCGDNDEDVEVVMISRTRCDANDEDVEVARISRKGCGCQNFPHKMRCQRRVR